MKIKSILGNSGAILTLIIAALVPFLLMGVFTKAFAGLGLRVDEMYSGGPKVRTIQGANYTIDIHREVSPHILQNEKPFVQLDWKPIAALPSHVSEQVDIDGDGNADVKVEFDVPKDPKAPLRADVDSLNPHFETMRNVERKKFSALIVRVDDAILIRIPVVK